VFVLPLVLLVKIELLMFQNTRNKRKERKIKPHVFNIITSQKGEKAMFWSISG